MHQHLPPLDKQPITESPIMRSFVSNNINNALHLASICLAAALATASHAATITASSGNPTDVQSAVNSAAAGDTVVVPAGSSTWASGVTISKSLILQGAGSSSTLITRGSGFNGPLVTVTSLPTDVPVRVTGFSFNNVIQSPAPNTFDVYVAHNPGSNFGYTKVRIDNCIFKKGQRVVTWQGWAYGVVDHCTFYDCWICGYLIGEENDLGDRAWARQDYQAGSGNFPFFEDCTFNWDTAAGIPGSPWVLYHEHGGRSILRHCTIDSHLSTNSIEGPIDMHGNQSYWTGASNDQRGSIRMEFYNNTVHLNNSFRTMDLRGGSALIHDNTFIYDTETPDICDFREEESEDSGTPVIWPAEDQINASFIWNNTVNGVAQTDSEIGVGTFGTAGDATYIQKGRDYWTTAPNAGTHTTYPEPRPPSSPSYPTTYSAVTSYTTFTYPHPLRSDSPTPKDNKSTR